VAGTILNIESQEMKFHEWGVGVDPDESCWVESVKFNLSFLVVIRVFYELGPPACEEIGMTTTRIRYDTRCYFNVRSKADISQLNLPHRTDN